MVLVGHPKAFQMILKNLKKNGTESPWCQGD